MEEPFIQVKSRKSRKLPKLKIIHNINVNGISEAGRVVPTIYSVIRKIESSVEALKDEGFIQSFLSELTKSFEAVKDTSNFQINLKKVVCFGLGNFSECLIARYQLALLILLHKHHKLLVELFDPVFTSQEKEILKEHYEFKVLELNEEGKRNVNEPTLFYMPHCPHQLVNNLLYSNWNSKDLEHCSIVCNSFSKTAEILTMSDCKLELSYLDRVQHFALEFPFPTTFKYTDVFNDTSIHVFPVAKRDLNPDFWLDKEEPIYESTDFKKKFE